MLDLDGSRYLLDLTFRVKATNDLNKAVVNYHYAFKFK